MAGDANSNGLGRAYAQQALADFNAYNHLQGSGLPECQSLHFLQMTCEKLAKAYLCRSGSEPSDLMGSHAYTAKVIPLVLRDQMEIQNTADSLVKAVTQLARHLSREIELLRHPSMMAGSVPTIVNTHGRAETDLRSRREHICALTPSDSATWGDHSQADTSIARTSCRVTLRCWMVRCEA